MRIKTSEIDGGGGRSGFTLIELLVVLAILALLVAVVPPLVSNSIPGAQLSSAAREITSALRTARTDAILHGRQTVFVLDVEKRSYVTGTPRRGGQIARGLSVALTTAQSERIGENIGGIRFFPDGSATGGEIFLATGARKTRISVQWLTGKVVVDDGSTG